MKLPDYLPQPGTPLQDLDTPALLIDLPAFERNIGKVADFYRDKAAKVRPHVKSHKCPDIAHIQLAAGGTNGGVCTAKLGEAEAMVGAGIRDVLVFNQITTRPKLQRLMALARHADVTVAVDDPENVSELADAARAFRVQLGVCVEVDIGIDRCGVDPGEPAVRLSTIVARSTPLRFRGLLGYEGAIAQVDFEERLIKTRQRIQRLLDTREMVERAGLSCEIVGGGGTATWNITGTLSGMTEVHPGRYCTADLLWRPMGDFEVALKVLTTVTSRPRKGLAIVDCGHKALHLNYLSSMDNYQPLAPDFDGFPEVEGTTGARVTALDAEHGRLSLDGSAEGLRRGDKLTLLPAYNATPINQHDYFFGIRDATVETVWQIAAGRRYQ